jgi:G3E family GTPase
LKVGFTMWEIDPEPSRKIPVHVLAGYLGSGKTTILNQLIGNSRRARLGVIVNDFGAINIDVDAVFTHHGETIGLSNGCVCCTIGDNLSEVLLKLANSATPPDGIIIESSGVARPESVAAHVHCSDKLALAGTAVVVDALNIEEHLADQYVGALVRGQIASASKVILNKCDTLDPDRREALISKIDRIADEGTPVLLGTKPRLRHLGLADIRVMACGIPPVKDDDIPSSRFSSYVFRSNRLFDRKLFSEVMYGLPDWMHRVKGRVVFDEPEKKPFLVHFTPGELNISECASAPPSALALNELVFIGPEKSFTPAIVRRALSE